MASFTTVDDTLTLRVRDRGEVVTVALSGTYDMTIVLERGLASGSGAWEVLRKYSEANATVSDTYVTERYGERLRLRVLVDNSGTCTATLTDGDKIVRLEKDEVGDEVVRYTQAGATFPGNLTVDGNISGTVANAAFDAVIFVPGVKSSNSVMATVVFTRTVVFPAGLTGSQAYSGTNATASTVLDIQKNGSNVGTITFTSAGATGAFAMASEQTFVAGDRLTVKNEDPADATLADVSITLKGTRS